MNNRHEQELLVIRSAEIASARIILRSPATSANQYDGFPVALVNLRFALETLDVANLGTRILSFDVPLILCDALVFECDSGFSHVAVMAVFGRRG
jgi:hypothetical protein